MPTQNIEEYIQEQRAQGLSDDAIRTILANAGWQVEDIERVLPTVEVESSPSQDDGAPNQDQFFLTNLLSWLTPNISPLGLIVFALIVDVVGFGACINAFDSSGSQQLSLLVAALIYLYAAILSFSAIIGLLKNLSFGRLLLIVLALAIGGWGAFWGGYGMLILSTGGTL